MDRIAQLTAKEKRYHFSQNARLFEGFFSRRIFGPLWCWWVILSGLVSMVATKQAGAAHRPTFYYIAIIFFVLSLWIAVGLLKESKRKVWLVKQIPVNMGLLFKIGLYFIPWLAGAVIAISILL